MIAAGLAIAGQNKWRSIKLKAKDSYDRSKLRPLGHEYDKDLIADEKLSNKEVYQRQLGHDLMGSNDLLELREKEFIANGELFVRYETVVNGCKRGFIMKQSELMKLTQANLKKLYGGLQN